MNRKPLKTYGFAMVVCRNNEGKWLAVKETRGRGWWLPAGGLESGENFETAAHRETLEEAGIEITLKGILRVEYSIYPQDSSRMRVVFYAEPKDPSQKPKSIPDEESEEARWVTIDEIKELKVEKPGLRGYELLDWANYITAGGPIAPLCFFCTEAQHIEIPLPPIVKPSDIVPVKPPESIPKVEKKQDEEEKEKPKAEVPPAELTAKIVEAIEKGNVDLVNKMIVEGYKPNSFINEEKWIALHYAIKNKDLAMIRMLLTVGSDIAAETHKGRNSIHFAVMESEEILDLILQKVKEKQEENKKKSVNARDIEGCTPLHFAASNNLPNNYMILVKYGADKSIKNNEGKLAKDCFPQ